jgi:excisionase family DNA binding protein
MNTPDNVNKYAFLFLDEAAIEFRESEKTVRRWIEAGKVAAFKHGGRWAIFKSEIQDYFERKRTNQERK